MKKALLILGGIVLLIGLVVTIVGVKVYNIYDREVILRNAFDAKSNDIETAHDTMWKSISQKYTISKDYQRTFINGIRALSMGREGGSVFKMNNESNGQLGLSTDVFNQMMATIDGKRAMLQREQNTLTDMWREHKTHCERPLNSIFIGSRVLPKPEMISSTRTKQAIETKRDDDISME